MSVSLKTKFRILFAAMILFTAAAGWLVVDRLAVVNSASGAIVDRLMPIRSELAAASRDVTRFRLAEARHILSTSDAAIAAEDANLRALHAAVDAALQSALDLLQGGDDARDIIQLRGELDAFVNDQEAVLVLSRANSNDAAFALYGKSTARFNAMDQRFDALSARMTAKVSEARDASRRVYATVTRGSAWVVGSVLLAAIAAAFYFERNVTRALLRLCACMGRIAEGDLSIEVPEHDRGDELGMMAKTVQTFRDNGLAMRRMEAEAAEQRAQVDAQRAQADAERAAAAEQRAAAEAERQRAAAEREAAAARQAEAMAALASGLAELANGNLTAMLEHEFAPDYERVRVDFNAAVSGVQASVRAIMTHSAAIAQGISEIAGSADDLAQRTEQQAAGLQQTAAALDEITARVKNAAENSGEAQSVAGQAQAETQTSETVVSQAVSAMGEIEGSARQIGQIIGVIDEIAFQTNLLALNAGVEAARAGEAGRGFAVVASEVRALAQRAADAAKEIKTLVTRSMRQVERGVQLVGDTGEALGRIQAGVRRINTAIGAIADSAREQAGGLTEINTAINQMDRVTQQNAAMVEESTAAVHSLSHEIEHLNQAISRFRIDATPHGSMPNDAMPNDAMRRPHRAQAA